MAGIWWFACRRCAREELLCGPCTRRKFCAACTTRQHDESNRESGRRYRQTPKGKERQRRQRVSSLAYYHRCGKFRRQQKRAEVRAHPRRAGTAPPPELPMVSGHPHAHETGYSDGAPLCAGMGATFQKLPCEPPPPPFACLTQTRGWLPAPIEARVGSAATLVPKSVTQPHGAKEHNDAEPPRQGQAAAAAKDDGEKHDDWDVHWETLVVTTVVAAKAALRSAQGRWDVRGRCARCGCAGKLMHCGGRLRRCGGDPDP